MRGKSVTRAVILVGGAGRRLGGTRKPLLPLAGTPLLVHILKTLSPQVDAIALATGEETLPYHPFGLPLLPDPVKEAGPLTGLVSALNWAKTDADRVAVIAGDTPFLPDDLIARLDTAQTHPNRCVFAASQGRTHYAVGLWPLAATDRITGHVPTGKDRSLAAVADLIGYDTAEWTGSPDPFFNINTPEDLARAEQEILASRRL